MGGGGRRRIKNHSLLAYAIISKLANVSRNNKFLLKFLQSFPTLASDRRWAVEDMGRDREEWPFETERS